MINLQHIQQAIDQHRHSNDEPSIEKIYMNQNDWEILNNDMNRTTCGTVHLNQFKGIPVQTHAFCPKGELWVYGRNLDKLKTDESKTTIRP